MINYSISYRTECSFSPDDSMVITGVSMEKGEKEGKLLFYDKNTFEKVQELAVTNSVSDFTKLNFQRKKFHSAARVFIFIFL